jgi:predicted phage terminase large subunit-like protein
MTIASLPLHLRGPLRDELLRRSLGHFHAMAFSINHGGEQLLSGPHIEAMAHALEQLARGTIKRLIITLPPRHGKSELVSGSFPAWLLGHDPSTKVTIASYGLDLSIPLVTVSRSILKDPSYRRVFPKTRIKAGQDRNDFFATLDGGSVRAASKAGAMTGLGTHYLVVDDFHKAGEVLSAVERENAIETFKKTFLTRFDNLADGRIVIVQQRLHVEDLVGWALRNGEWHHLNLPAIAEQNEEIELPRGVVWRRRKGEVLAPQLASREFLDGLRREMGPRDFGAQFQQNPVVADGGLIDLSWFGQYEERRPRGFYHKIVQSWDPAITERVRSDYSVGMTWGFRDGRWYLLDLIRVQWAFNRLVDRVLAWHRQWRADALIIEGASIGHALWEQAKRAKLPGMVLCPTPRLSKLDRVAACTTQLQSGDFILPDAADWLPALRSELLAFPDGAHDDQVDALTQFVEFCFRRKEWAGTYVGKDGRLVRPPRSRRPSKYPADA